MARNTLQLTTIVAIVLGASLARAADPPGDDPLNSLDRKINANLQSDNWAEASVVFVRALWRDYRNAHTKNQPGKRVYGIDGKLPEITDYDEYVGEYNRTDGGKSQKSLSIEKDDQGRFFARLGRHLIPAVATNKCIVFTTGDVVYSRLPRFAAKRYATLEMYVLGKFDGEYRTFGYSENLGRSLVLQKQPVK